MKPPKHHLRKYEALEYYYWFKRWANTADCSFNQAIAFLFAEFNIKCFDGTNVITDSSESTERFNNIINHFIKENDFLLIKDIYSYDRKTLSEEIKEVHKRNKQYQIQLSDIKDYWCIYSKYNHLYPFQKTIRENVGIKLPVIYTEFETKEQSESTERYIVAAVNDDAYCHLYCRLYHIAHISTNWYRGYVNTVTFYISSPDDSSYRAVISVSDETEVKKLKELFIKFKNEITFDIPSCEFFEEYIRYMLIENNLNVIDMYFDWN